MSPNKRTLEQFWALSPSQTDTPHRPRVIAPLPVRKRKTEPKRSTSRVPAKRTPKASVRTTLVPVPSPAASSVTQGSIRGFMITQRRVPVPIPPSTAPTVAQMDDVDSQSQGSDIVVHTMPSSHPEAQSSIGHHPSMNDRHPSAEKTIAPTLAEDHKEQQVVDWLGDLGDPSFSEPPAPDSNAGQDASFELPIEQSNAPPCVYRDEPSVPAIKTMSVHENVGDPQDALGQPDGTEEVIGDEASDSDVASDVVPDDVSVATEFTMLSNEVDRAREAADILFPIMTGKLMGCTAEAHRRMTEEHGSNHHGLKSTYAGLKSSTDKTNSGLGLESDGFRAPATLNRHSCTPGPKLSTMFEGTTKDEEEVRNICLHQDHVTNVPAESTHDVDSVLVFPTDFSAFRTTMRYCPSKNVSLKITTNVHLKVKDVLPLPKGHPTRNAMLKDVPHLYIGDIDGFHKPTVFLIWPELYNKGKKFTYLTDEHARRFHDRAWRPAYEKSTDQDDHQGSPPVWDVARLKARAQHSEHLERDRGGNQYTTYPVKPENMTKLWEELTRRIDDSKNGIQDFRNPIIYVTVKNMKLEFKVKHSMYKAMENFDAKLATIFDMSRVRRIFRDLAIKIHPINQTEEYDSFANDADPMMYLWKSCCLQSIYTQITDSPKPPPNYYHIGFLRDTGCIGFEPKAKTKLARGGVKYFQMYSSFKEIGDAQGVYPFDEANLKELAVDPSLWLAYASIRHALHARSRADLVSKYTKAKERVKKSYAASMWTQFAIRVELRGSDEFWQATKERARQEEEQDPQYFVLSEAPSFAWAVPTHVFVSFMLGNYNKFTTALEMISATSPAEGISHERSKLMLTLVKCLQRFANSHIPREMSLWSDETGVGMKSTMKNHGYGWFQPVVDWDALCFTPAAQAKMLVGNKFLMSWYSNQGRLLQDTGELIDSCIKRLKEGCRNEKAEDVIMVTMAHLCIRQYRRDVLDNLRRQHDIKGRELEADDDKDEFRFCWEDFRPVLVDEIHMITGRKAKGGPPSQLFTWLFGQGAGFRRDHFEYRPFRMMAQRVAEALVDRPHLQQDWVPTLRGQFIKYMWMVPYPHENGGLLSIQKKTKLTPARRRFWASAPNRTASPADAGRSWSQDKRVAGRPPAFPATLAMTSKEFCHHIDTLDSKS